MARQRERPEPGPGGLDAALRIAVPVAVAIWAGLALADVLAPGLPVEFDAHSHLARAGFVAEALRDGRLPMWSFQWYGGWRLLEFYAPAWYLLVGALGLVTADVVTATKAALFAVQGATALGLYAFSRRLRMGTLAAAIPPLLFLASPQRAWALGVVGNYPSAIATAAAVAYLWLAAGTPARDTRLAPLAARRALVLALALLGHLQAAFLLPGLAAFDGVRLTAALGARRAATVVAAGLVGAALLTAFAWLPMLVDLRLVSLSLDAGALGRHLEPGPLLVAIGLRPFTWDHVYVRDHGLAWVVLAALGALLGAVARDRRALALCAGLAAVAAATVVLGERAVAGLGLFLWPLVALVPGLVASRWPARRARVEPVLAVALLLLALARPGGAPPVARYAPADELAAYASLPPTPTASRTFDRTPRALCLDGFYGSSSAAPLVSGRAVAFGGFPQGAPVAANLDMALLSPLGREATPGDATLDALYLLHVGFLVRRGDRPERLRLEHASPALFAPRLVTLPTALAPPPADGSHELRLLSALRERWRRDPLDDARRDPSLAPLARTRRRHDDDVVAPAVAAMRIDRARARAERIFVDGPAPPPADAPEPDAALEVLEHRESPGRVDLVVRAPGPGWLRLAYAFDPGLELRVDDRPAPLARDSLGAAVAAVPAGRHALVLRPRTPVLRSVLLVSCVSLAGALAWLAARPRGAA